MKKVFAALMIVIVASAFSAEKSLKGTWEYAGGIYNGKKDPAPTDFSMQRKYQKGHFEAFAIEKGETPVKYETGDYMLKGDSCIETQTYSSQPTKLLGIPVRYLYELRNDSLILRGTLPTGMVVVEYWKHLK